MNTCMAFSENLTEQQGNNNLKFCKFSNTFNIQVCKDLIALKYPFEESRKGGDVLRMKSVTIAFLHGIYWRGASETATL